MRGLLAFALGAALTLPVDRINEAFKGHTWSFPIDGKQTEADFVQFKKVGKRLYSIVIEVK